MEFLQKLLANQTSSTNDNIVSMGLLHKQVTFPLPCNSQIQKNMCTVDSGATDDMTCNAATLDDFNPCMEDRSKL